MHIVAACLFAAIGGSVEFRGLLVVEQPSRQSEKSALVFVDAAGKVEHKAALDTGVYGIGNQRLFAIVRAREGFVLQSWGLADGKEVPAIPVVTESTAPTFPLEMIGTNEAMDIDAAERFAYFTGHVTRKRNGVDVASTIPTFGCVDLKTGKVFGVGKPRPDSEFATLWCEVNSQVGVREWDGRFWSFDPEKRRFNSPLAIAAPLDQWEFYIQDVGLMVAKAKEYVVLSTAELKPRVPPVSIPRDNKERIIIRGAKADGVLKVVLKGMDDESTSVVITDTANDSVVSRVMCPMAYQGVVAAFSADNKYVLFSSRTEKKARLWSPDSGEISSIDISKFSRPVIYPRFVSAKQP